MSASYCFVLHGRCIAPRVRDSIFAEHQRPPVAAFMECVDFMQPRWPSRISTFNSIFCRSFRFGTREFVGDIVRDSGSGKLSVAKDEPHSDTSDTIGASHKMSLFKPTSDERETLKKAVAKFAHDPIKSQLLSRLDVEDAEYSRGSEEWNHLKFCVEQNHLHVQTELRRNPKKKPAKLELDKADALARKFHPNFS